MEDQSMGNRVPVPPGLPSPPFTCPEVSISLPNITSIEMILVSKNNRTYHEADKGQRGTEYTVR